MQADSFSLWQFYVRRICRILPTLLIVLTFVTLAGWYLLLPHEFTHLGKHIAASASFLSNMLLYSEHGYFNRASELKPLLHIWSLAIEEQFYLIWPFVLMVGWKRPKYFFPVFFATILLSFGLNTFRIPDHPIKSFFILHHRVWELLLGASLAFAHDRSWLPKLPSWLSPIGFALIAIALMKLTPLSPYPGFWALLPTVGALLIIASPATVLSYRPIVAIGLVSYPLYLWHWPLISFARIMNFDFTWQLAFGLITVSLIFSYLTYRLIEQPIRRLANPQRNKLAVVLLFTSMLVVICGILIYFKKIRTYSHTERIGAITSAAEDWIFPGKAVRFRLKDGFDYHVLGDGEEEFVFVGDSHIMQYYPRIERIIAKDQKVFFFTLGPCPPIPSVYYTDLNIKFCEKGIETAFDIAKRATVKAVVLGPSWVGKFTGETKYYFQNNQERQSVVIGSIGFERSMESLRTQLQVFKMNGKKAYLILSIPYGDAFDPGRMFERSLSLTPIKFKPETYDRRKLAPDFAQVLIRLREVAESAGATVIDPMDHFCEGEVCDILDDHGVPKYFDGIHIRATYAREHVTYLDEVLKQWQLSDCKYTQS